MTACPVPVATDESVSSGTDPSLLRYIGRHVVFGNHKLPETTAIWNCCSAHDCPARPLGLCQAGKHCYALNTERYQMNALPFRRRQREIMDTVPAPVIAKGILKRCLGRELKVKLFRFGQSGDFRDQRDIETMVVICRTLTKAGIGCYGFTSRTDLNLKPLLKTAHIGVSNDKGNWIRKGANRFLIVQHPSGKHFVCPKDCTICDRCSTVRGKIIETERWWGGQMTFNDFCDYCMEWE